MSQPSSSYRTILRSSSIMGASSVVNILAGLVKMKVAAVLLGPAGVGLVGLYLSLMQTAVTVASLGFGSVGTRQIAEANATGGEAQVALVRRALFWGTMVLAVLGASVFWLASGWIARDILREPERAGEVAWLSLGVALLVASGSQGALLTGLRRIGDMARMGIAGGIVGAALGIAALMIWGAEGLLAMVLVGPLVAFVTGYLYVSRLGRPAGAPARLAELWPQWRRMATLGFAFMLSGLVATVGHLAVRTLVQRDLGAEELGQFQAAWAIGMTYLGFVLGAMGTDYYPRLTAAIADHEKAARLVNEQTEVALLLCAPVLLAMLALAPWVIRLLYTAEFAPAADVLRWQLLGDILKIVSVPLGFVLVAQGAGQLFILTESIGVCSFVVGTAVLLPLLGVEGAGIAFVLYYVVYLPMMFLLVRRRIGFLWSPSVRRIALGLAFCALLVAALTRFSEPLAAGIGLTLAAAFGLFALVRLGDVAQLCSLSRTLAELGRKVMHRAC